jgi:hypothetical protein
MPREVYAWEVDCYVFAIRVYAGIRIVESNFVDLTLRVH